ncbi:MAG: selenocysteine-specific translation elongation factor [Myxococcales bacterium]|nr:selenocysteine-specific translation elongation factor [Myxococcales bacterium]
MSDLVLGTAGHVDHGKTSLVRALTGVDLDRLPEERARGITIVLGFVPLVLPDGRVAGLVDVPGHETLVRTMVSGATGMDAVMLCVSAVEGVMPQTREHLAVLRLLGVPRLIAVQTMADLVDDELLGLAADELRELLADTPWPDAPIVATSTLTGRGLEPLRAVLGALPTSGRAGDGPFRMPVDRAFVRRGFGTVVTGTVWGGRLHDGNEVDVFPGGHRARVRGIQVHGRSVSHAAAGSRAALNLTGLEIDDVGRGIWVASAGAIEDCRVIDVTYHHLETSPLLLGEPGVLVLHGTREVSGRLYPIGAEGLEPGQSIVAQLHLAEALPCLPGDRFVVRRASPAATLGGGLVLDPWTTVIRRRRHTEALVELHRLAAGDRVVYLERAGTAGMTEAHCVARCGALVGTRLGERRYADGAVAAFRDALLKGLSDRHAAEPLAPGVNRKAAWVGALRALDERTFLTLLEGEAAAGRVRLDGGRVRLPEWQVRLNADQTAWTASVLAAAEAAGYDGAEVPAARPDHDALVFLLRDRGEIEIIAGRTYSGPVLVRLAELVRGHFAEHPTLEPAGFKTLTGQSRRTAIPLLEWLDSQGVTRRVGDARVRG